MPLIATRGAASAQGFGEFAQQAAVVQAEAIDFGADVDYLTKTGLSTSFTGSVTFSCWFYYTNTASASDSARILYLYNAAGDGYFEVRINLDYNGSQSLDCRVVDDTGTIRMAFYNDASIFGQWIKDTWYNLLIGFTTGSPSTLYVYLNDTAVSMTQWGGSSSGGFNATACRIAANENLNSTTSGRLSNVYLAYTYTNFSLTANRRKFITADLQPAAGQAALNPLFYLTMADPTQPGKNSGTGGDFTLTGTVARSGRGPNQYNAPGSQFNGTSQSLYRATVGGSSKLLTISFNTKNWTGTKWLLDAGVSASPQSIFLYGQATNFTLTVRNASNTTVLSLDVVAPSGFSSNDRWYNVVISVDLSDTAKRFVYINGVAATVTWNTYTNDNMNLSYGTTLKIGCRYDDTNFYDGQLSNFYLDQSYVDLSVAANLAKFVTGTGINAKPVSLGANGELPTGSSPLIYLPLYGNSPGVNKGTAGDFTAGAGSNIGSRGPNEYWASAVGSTGYLYRNSALSGATDNTTLTFFALYKPSTTGTQRILWQCNGTAGGALRGMIQVTSGNFFRVDFYNSAGSVILSATASSDAINSTSTTYAIHFSVDLTNTSNRSLYINGVAATVTWTTYTNANMNFSAARSGFGADWGASWSGGQLGGSLGSFYLNNAYVDFTQESNRLLFADIFNQSTNIPSAITAATIANPLIFMLFDPASKGTNSGTGGNYTDSSMSDGGQL